MEYKNKLRNSDLMNEIIATNCLKENLKKALQQRIKSKFQSVDSSKSQNSLVN